LLENKNVGIITEMWIDRGECKYKETTRYCGAFSFYEGKIYNQVRKDMQVATRNENMEKHIYFSLFTHFLNSR
jgi:hypothetical protein